VLGDFKFRTRRLRRVFGQNSGHDC